MITSLKNRKVDQAVKLKRRLHREHEKLFLIEGAQVIGEALEAGIRPTTLLQTESADDIAKRARAAGAEVLDVSESVMSRIASTVSPQGVVAIAPFLDVELAALPEEATSVAILAAIRDPGNAGTILRSADAAGIDGVVFASTSVDVYNPKAVRASSGSLFHLPVVRETGVEDAARLLRDRGFTIFATAPDGDADIYEVELSGKTAFVFGNESWGLPEDVSSAVDYTVRIPQAGAAESLNVAAAATVCLFEAARRRGEKRRARLETMIAAAAHDIRSPLTAMKGFGYALAKRWAQMSDEQRDTMFQAIIYDTDRLDTIVRQLVDAARITTGRLDLFPERTNIRALVEELAQSVGRDPEHPDVVWRGGDLTVMIDADRLRVTVGAFFEAAVWWCREGPIEVTAALDGDLLRVDVYRRGTDLSQQAADALFSPRPPGSGSGSKIGLFVARGVAEAMGGRAGVEVDEGLRFGIEVPVAGDDLG